MDILTLAVAALATARMTRLITTDHITAAPAGGRSSRLDPEGLLAYLVVCDWCASVYVGAAVAGTWWAWGDTWFHRGHGCTGVQLRGWVAGVKGE